MPILELLSKERSELRSAAHPLKPVVLIGDKGLTDAVIKEIDTHLSAHELIKIKIASDDRALREEMLQTICHQLSAAPVHHLGKTLIIYRPSEIISDNEFAPEKQPSLRKPNEDYTPKKLAAEGIKNKTARGFKKPKTKIHNKSESLFTKNLAEDSAQKHSIPARKGSALSLRKNRRK